MAAWAMLGMRAARAWGSRSRSTSRSPVTLTRGARRRTSARSATTSRAQPDVTSAPASTLRARAASSTPARVVGAQQQDLAGVGVRRARLGEEVVAVVPLGHQTEVVDRGEGGRPGARDDLDVPAGDGEEGPVARGRAEVGGQHDVPVRAEGGGQGRVEPGQVTGVGDAQDRAPPRPSVAAAAWARPVAQSSPGATVHTARGGATSPSVVDRAHAVVSAGPAG